MTALSDYQRLEATALWRPEPEAQRREVIVAIGTSSLTLSDPAGRALAHWSLAAVRRLNRGVRPALFSPGADAPDTLEVADEDMVAAIEKVRRAVERARPRPGRLRLVLVGAALAGLAVLAVTRLPEALVTNALHAVPEAKRAEIGERMLAAIARVGGAPCATPQGRRALDVLQARLRGNGAGRIEVLPGGVVQSASLPGGILLVDRAVVEDFDDPAALAGFVLAEDLRRAAGDPLTRLLRDRGWLAALRLLATGDLPDTTLAAYAEVLVAQTPAAVSDADLLARFAAAGVPSTPYAHALDISGETVLGLIEADPGMPDGAAPVLSDADWIGLQAICGG